MLWKAKRLFAVIAVVVLVHAPSIACAVAVENAAQLAEAVRQANAGGDKNIVLEDGVYTLDQMLWIGAAGVSVRSSSGNREAVIVQGRGMGGAVTHIFNVAASNFTVRDMTLRRVSQHAVQLQPDVDSALIRNLHVLDTGEQMIKVAYAPGDPRSSDNGIMENCLLEYSAGVGPQYYIGGIDAHFAKNWIVRDNTFKHIRSPSGSCAEHAIHFWSDSQNTLVERNRIINCDRGIGFGLGDRGHTGGIIRNNMIYHDSSGGFGDVGIGLESAVNARVYNNTVYFQHGYPNAVEYRFAITTGLLIANNLTNKAITRRDGASAIVSNNVTNAAGSWFKNPSAGDLHLISPIASVVDKGKALSGLADDLDKNVRPQGLNYDIGADEFGESFVGITGLADLNGNGSGEIALLRERSGATPGLVVIQDTETGEIISSISFLATGYTPRAIAVMRDINGNGAPELAVLGVHSTTNVVLIQVRDALSRQLVNNVYFNKASSPGSFSVIEDVDGNGAPELAVLGVNAGAGKAQVEVRDPLTKRLIRSFQY
ncbi:MAG: right-handed parallel beta-helix repeat-containing protein [Syntrophobacteraceae bacterium]